MVDRVLEQTPDDRRHQHLIRSWQDIAVLELVNAVIKPVAEFTDLPSDEIYVTQWSHPLSLTSGGHQVEDVQCSRGEVQTSSPTKLFAQACLVDPRYRGNHFDDDTEETKCALIKETLAVEDRGSGASASTVVQVVVPPNG